MHQNKTCELCRREVQNLTRHHLIPRTRHRNKRMRRLYDRDELLTRILFVCRACHNHIHNTITEKQLAEEFNSRERLLTHPQIQSFIHWISQRPAGVKPRSVKSNK